jgi:hypothetical protein
VHYVCIVFEGAQAGQQVGLYDSEMPHRIYFWRVQNNRGRWFTTRHRATEDVIRRSHPEAQRIESDSMEIPDIDPMKPTYHASLHDPNYRGG